MIEKSSIILHTERLYLRTFILADAKAFYEMNSVAEVMRYTGDKAFSDEKEARTFINNYSSYSQYGFGRWAMIRKEDNQFIGFCGFKLNEEQMIDLGFRIKIEYWNQGYATEAASACLEYGFSHLDFHEVIGRAARANIASLKVLQKLGMTYWKDGTCGDIDNSVYYKIEKQTFENGADNLSD